MREIPQAAIDLVSKFEETHLFAYDDAHYPPKEAAPGDRIDGTLTAGTGHTGPDVTAGMNVTAAMNKAWISSDLSTAMRRIYKRIGPVADELTDNQLAALLDFTFALGDGDDTHGKPEWTIWKRLRERNFDQVPHEMGRFVNWNGSKSLGLVRRRNAEAELWATDEPGTVAGDAPSASITRCTPTPPTPTDPVPPKKSKGLIAGAGAAVMAIPAAVDQASHALEPYARHSEWIERAIAGAFTVAGICAGVSWFYMYLQKRNARN